MISRFTRPEAQRLFSDLTKKGYWHQVEIAFLRAREKRGRIRLGIANIAARVAVTEEILKRADEIEAVTDHDLIAFIKAIVELLEEQARPHYHEHLTSFDDEDTALAMIMLEALDLIIASLMKFRKILVDLAQKHRRTIMIGRTHHIHAKPITFGLKVLGWLDKIDFHIDQLQQAKPVVGIGKLSGAVGTYSEEPEVEELTCQELGLTPARISNQIVGRHIHLYYGMRLVAVANSLDKIATDIRLLAGTDIGEVAEFKAKGAKGSSAMPGKSKLRNPIKSENVSSLAKAARGYIIPALECENLWNERTLDNSAAERIWIPDLTTLVHFMVERLADTIAKMEVYPKQMLANLNRTGGIVYAENVMNELTKHGLDRQLAYDLVEGYALATESGSFLTEVGKSFRELVEESPEIAAVITSDEIAQCFNPLNSLKHVDASFARFGLQPLLQ